LAWGQYRWRDKRGQGRDRLKCLLSASIEALRPFARQGTFTLLSLPPQHYADAVIGSLRAVHGPSPRSGIRPAIYGGSVECKSNSISPSPIHGASRCRGLSRSSFNPPSTDNRRRTAPQAPLFRNNPQVAKTGLCSYVHYARVLGGMTVRAVAAKRRHAGMLASAIDCSGNAQGRILPLAAKLPKTHSTGPFWPRGPPVNGSGYARRSLARRVAPVLRAPFERRPSGPIISFFSLHKLKRSARNSNKKHSL
jgi:hypothetical protein